VHPLVRDAVYRAVPSAERALAHERAGRLVRLRGGSAEQAGAHLLLAPSRGDSASVEVLSAAARTAAARGASESAVTYLRRALAEPAEGRARLDVLCELGLLETLVDGPAGLEHLGAAYELATEPAARAELAVAIAWTHVFTSSPGVASAFAQDASAALPDDLVDARQGLVALQADQRVHARARPGPVAGRARAGRAGRRRRRPDAGRDAGVGGGLRRHRPGPVGRAGPVRAAEDRLSRWTAGCSGWWPPTPGWSPTTTSATSGSGRAPGHARGSLFTALSVNLWQGLWQWRRGELGRGGGVLRGDAGAGAHVGRVRHRPSIRAGLPGRCATSTGGDLDAARATAELALASSPAGEGGRLVRHAVARLRLGDGDWAEALALLDAAGDSSSAAPTRLETVSARCGPRRSAGLGRRRRPSRLQREEVACCAGGARRASSGPGCAGWGDLGGAGLEHLREAVAVLAPTTAELEKARAELALGRSPDVPDGRPSAAARRPVAAARDCGAQQVFADACAALSRARPRPSREPATSRRRCR
jgi:hypothetical protein